MGIKHKVAVVPAPTAIQILARSYEAARKAADRAEMDRTREALVDAIVADGKGFADVPPYRYVPTEDGDDLMRFRTY